MPERSIETASPRPLALGEAIEQLGSPYALENFSSLTGTSPLVVDLTCEGRTSSDEAIATARRRLGELPAPSIALGARAAARGRSADRAACADASQASGALPHGAEQLLEDFDVVLPDERNLPALLGNLDAHPIASLAMVQLLRHSAEASLHEGLIAESFVYSTLQAGDEFAHWLSDRKPREVPEHDEPAVLLLRDGSRLHITLNRPDRRNAFSAEMRDALCDALRVVLADPTIEDVVLRGAGPSFCSGGDLDEFGTLPDPATAHAIRSVRNASRLLAECSARVRSEVQGACVGAGIELPAFTRHVTADRDAFFWLPEVAMGLVPGAGGTVSIPRRIGRQRTNELALSSRRIDAETALAWGLVDEIV